MSNVAIRRTALLGLAPLLLLWPSWGQGAEVTRAQMLVNSCAGCHGPGGQSPGAIPSLAGKSPEFIERAMKEFRSGDRPATVMNRHAKGYSDEDIKLIGQYFSEQ